MTIDARQGGDDAAVRRPLPLQSGRWTIVGLLFAASVINYLDRSTISLALPLVSRDLVLGPESKGLLLSAFFWSYALMQIPVGWAADRFNLRWLYAAAFVLWSLGQGLTGFAGSLGVLLLFRMLLGVGESIYLPGGTKIVSLLFGPAERGLPCGLFDFGTRMGLVLGGLTVPWLLVHLGWRLTFRLIGFAASVVAYSLAIGHKAPSCSSRPPGFGSTSYGAASAVVAYQSRPDRYLPRFLLLRLLLVSVCHLASGLPGDGTAFHYLARRLFRLASFFRIWRQRTLGWLACGLAYPARLERNANA